MTHLPPLLTGPFSTNAAVRRDHNSHTAPPPSTLITEAPPGRVQGEVMTTTNTDPELQPAARSEWQMVSLDVLREKYAKGAERELDGAEMVLAIHERVARALADQEHSPDAFTPRFLAALQAGFIPGGRINSAAGTDIKNATLINCFVQPVGDSISSTVGGKPGIYHALRDAAETMRRGGGVGYDFSSIRPAGAKVIGTASAASGPVSYMQVFDQSCATVESAGFRRGAQMGVLRCDHPDILVFIHAKEESGNLNNFNLSVGVTDAFMEAVTNQSPFELVHEAEPSDQLIADGAYQRADGLWVYTRVNPKAIWEAIMKNTYNAAEPGVLFLDRINRENNLHYCEKIEATNPCGEIPIPDYGCCCLGSFNLCAFVAGAFTDQASFDFDRFSNAVKVAVRMLDNVLDATAWPLPQQQQEAADKRRIGLGYTGLGDMLIMLGLRYDSQEGRDFAAGLTCRMRDAAYQASIDLAVEKGAFPKFDAGQFLNSGMARRLPETIRARIKKHGIKGIEFLFKKNKVDYIKGVGTITVPGMVEVTDGPDKGKILATEKTLIATGCKPRQLPDLEVDGERIMTSRQALEMKTQPKSIVIVGAGAIGAEFAYFLNAFGTKVTLVEMLDQVLPVEDHEVAAVVAQGV